MKYVVLGIVGVLLVCILVELIRKHAKRKSETRQEEPPIATGCGTGESCIYLNLGKATAMEKSEGYCWCEYYEDIRERQDHCPGFKSRGCKEGMCIYADFKTPKENGYSPAYCFCSYYNQIFEGKTTCPYYIDYFETPEGDEVRRVLRNAMK